MNYTENIDENLDMVEVTIGEDDMTGVSAISIVENPAIEEDFVFLSKVGKVELQEVDNEKKILMGPALVPNKPIYRVNGDQEYYICLLYTSDAADE